MELLRYALIALAAYAAWFALVRYGRGYEPESDR